MQPQKEPPVSEAVCEVRFADGQVYRYTFLADSPYSDCPMGVRIIDFGYVFTLPKPTVRQLARLQGKHLRLCPPYREHLAQAFARFFMRVGLPQQYSCLSRSVIAFDTQAR